MIQSMISWVRKTAVLLALAVAAAASGADKLAIAEVQTSGKVDPAQVEGFAAFLETNVDGGYQLVTRAGLRAMMTELGLQNISDLVNQQQELARLNEVHAVKYLLIPTVGRIGTRYNLSLVVVDCATGAIHPEQRATLVGDDFDQLVMQLDNTLAKMGLARPSTEAPVTAILLPTLKLKGAPDYLAEDFTTELQSYLLGSGIKLVDRQVIDKIQAESNMTRLDLAAPGQFSKIGQLAIAGYLVCPIIDRFGFTSTAVNVEYSGRTTVKQVGNISGLVKIVETKTGNAVAAFTFKKSMRATDIPIAERRDYEERDYDDALLAALMRELAPKVAQALKEALAPTPPPVEEAVVVTPVEPEPAPPEPVPPAPKTPKKITVTTIVEVKDIDEDVPTTEAVSETQETVAE